MIIALIDNGSLEPAATLNLRRVAAALTANVGVLVHPVSWKHSDRIAPAELAAATGRIVVSGMGKSGHIGGKIAATLASTGTPAFFATSATLRLKPG